MAKGANLPHRVQPSLGSFLEHRAHLVGRAECKAVAPRSRRLHERQLSDPMMELGLNPLWLRANRWNICACAPLANSMLIRTWTSDKQHERV